MATKLSKTTEKNGFLKIGTVNSVWSRAFSSNSEWPDKVNYLHSINNIISDNTNRMLTIKNRVCCFTTLISSNIHYSYHGIVIQFIKHGMCHTNRSIRYIVENLWWFIKTNIFYQQQFIYFGICAKTLLSFSFSYI